MSRILKRPMFRTGGTPNEGIMHGLVNRRGYSKGTEAERYRDEYMKMLAEIQPAKPKFNMGQMGLNLISGEYAGEGLLQNIAGSAQDPYAAFTAADDARGGLDYQKRMTATTMGIKRAEAEELARRKAAGTSTMQKDYTTERKKFMLFQEYTKDPKDKFGKTVYKVHPEIMANYGSYIQDEAMKTEEGRKFLRQTDGIVPHTVKRDKGRDVVVVSYDKLLAGGVYFDPTYNAFVQRVPRSDEDGEVIPEHIILIDPYTFEEVRKINLK